LSKIEKTQKERLMTDFRIANELLNGYKGSASLHSIGVLGRAGMHLRGWGSHAVLVEAAFLGSSGFSTQLRKEIIAEKFKF
jgi:hypothetical protein